MRDLIDGVFWDLSEDSTKIESRIKVVEFGGADQTLEGCGALSAGVGSHEKIVLSPQHDRA